MNAGRVRAYSLFAARCLGVLFVLAVVGCGDGGRSGSDGARPRGGKLRVVASIFPLADVAREVGGDRVAVTTLLPPGASPHGFEPQPLQAEALSRADLLLVVGMEMDPWAERSAKATGTSIPVLDLAEAVGEEQHDEPGSHDADEHPHAGEDHHHHAHGDPHLWLDPVLMKEYVAALAATLADLDPDHAGGYRDRADAFAAKLDALDREYRRKLADAKTKAFVTFHPAFSHLAERYGLEQTAMTGSHADEGGPEQLEHVVAFVKKHNLNVVFAEPQFPAEKLAWLREQTGAHVGRLDPLGGPDSAGYDGYLAMMRSNLAELAKALAR
jgi:zinc transport system substrate-binding protein